MRSSEIKPEVYDLARRAEALAAPQFTLLQEVCERNTQRVMDAFQEFRVSEACFAGTTGYGYDDLGRETLEKIYARVFGTEAALVRPHFVNGTHAITAALFALCRPGEAILAATGKPYDTLHHAIGITGEEFGSLRFYGIGYRQVELLPDGQPDLPGIREALEDPAIKAVTLQRSIGYSTRKALSIEQIQSVCSAVKEKRKDVSIFVDNCYGEFTDVLEPTHVGADLMAGSLIKNPGGGLAPTGGYIAGRADLVERAAGRMTLPGIGGECGSTLGISRLLFQGFFMAPHVVMQAMKTAVFSLGSPEKMEAFCRGIQAGAPVDSFVSPVPAPMPGYDFDVIMAAGAFIQGSSIELSCDGPVRDPFCVYLQGGLTYESGKLGVMMAVSGMM